MSQVARQQVDRPVRVLRAVTGFLVGLVASAVLVVVIPPLSAVLLVALLVAVGLVRVRTGRFTVGLTATLLGVLTFSIYTLIWVLALSN